MTSIFDLPIELIGKVIYENLDTTSIGNCYLANSLFQSLYNKQLKIIDDASTGFMESIRKGNLDPSNGFMELIKKGNLEACKWFYMSNIKECNYRNLQIKLSCDNKNLQFIFLPINIHANNEDAFQKSCYYGHLNIAKWLYDLSIKEDHPIGIYTNKLAFTGSCMLGLLEVAKWLTSIYPNFHIETDNDEIVDWWIDD